MRQDKFTYERAEQCFYEVMRVGKTKSGKFTSSRERNALIDEKLTYQNVIIKKHECLSEKNYTKDYVRGSGIAEYHKKVSGRTARMNGPDNQKSKAIGCIITLPRLDINESEYKGLELLESNECIDKKKIIKNKIDFENLSKYRKEYTEKEREEIVNFLTMAYKAWLINAGIREEDVLYAVLHFDESVPHIHILSLPTVRKENGEYTFSTSRFNKDYYDKMHPNVINILQQEFGEYKYSPHLINGVMKTRENQDFNKYNQEQRMASMILNKKIEQAHNELAQAKIEKEDVDNQKGDIVEEISHIKEDIAIPLKNDIIKKSDMSKKLNADIELKKKKIKELDKEIAKKEKQNKYYKPLFFQAFNVIRYLFKSIQSFIEKLFYKHGIKYELQDIVDDDIVEEYRELNDEINEEDELAEDAEIVL